MHFTSFKFTLLALIANGASAVDHVVEVGQNGRLTFSPDNIEAAEGDVVKFHFNSMHDVVAGDFSKPCTPVSSGGFYSGSLPSDGESVFSITINSTDPIFFYCSVDGHCQDGMSGVINQGSDTLDSYKSAAKDASDNVTPESDGAFGGTLGDSSSDSTSTGTATATSEASGTVAVTSAPTASGTESQAASPTSSAAAGHLAGPAAGVGGLALVLAGMLAL